MSNLEKQLIRLGEEQPDLRKHLKPILDTVLKQARFDDDSGLTLEMDRGATIYFDLHFEDYNLEEDLMEGRSHLDGDYTIEDFRSGDQQLVNEMLQIEVKGQQYIGQLLGGRSVRNEGHTSDGTLVCKFVVTDLADLKDVYDKLGAQMMGGGDIDVAPYLVARGFTMYPQSVNDGAVSFEYWDQYIERHGGKGRRSSQRRRRSYWSKSASAKRTIVNHAFAAMEWADEHLFEYASRSEGKKKVEQLVDKALRDDRIAQIVEDLDRKHYDNFGHDLYLTSQGHGAGFWDGDWRGILPQEDIDYLTDWCGKQSQIYL